jgi:hypothetical protein
MLGMRTSRVRLGVVWLCATVAFGTGCKTQDDAAAAAAQMATTATALTNYYTALKTILTNIDKVRTLNHDLYGKPYPDADRQIILGEAAKLDQRAKLADAVTSLSTEFGKLTGSTAPVDVGTAAGKLQTEADSLAGLKESSAEQAALKLAVKQLAELVQERKERQIAKAMAPVVKALSDFFTKEEAPWAARETEYATFSETLAKSLVTDGRTDNTSLLKAALDPYGLTGLSSTELNQKLAPMATAQIESDEKTLNDGYTKASDGMEKSLSEMATRIQTVADEKPMAYRKAPLSLTAVDNWTAQMLGQDATSTAASSSGSKKN